MSADTWHSYAALNEAVAEELFSLDRAGRPVYALPGPDEFDAVFKRAGLPCGDEGRLTFLRQVRGTLVVDDDGVNPFSEHIGRSRRHRQAAFDTPPSLALLVILSMAADSMHAGEGMAAHNYYGRLMGLLDVPEWRRSRVQTAYQADAEVIWSTLNAWLEAWEGERGVPTAYAVGQRYIGLPMSQALVRQRDREKLVGVFAAEGLPPGYQMAGSDMEAVLDDWVNRQPPVLSHALRILWSNAAARERIAAVACLELAAWHGDDLAAHDERASRYSPLRLMARTPTFPRPRIELNLTLPAPAADDAYPTVTLAGADGPVPMRLVPSGTGSLRLEDATLIDPASLVADEVSLTVDGRALVMSRLPRRLVPLRRDDLQNCYVEVERVQLGEDTILLAANGLRPRIEAVLDVVARPGWQVAGPETEGVPEGWVLFKGVQVFDRFIGSVHVDLQPLLPRSAATLALAGGFSLPGRLRKWSSLDPPEVQVVTPSATCVKVRVDKGTGLGDEVLTRTVGASVAVLPLADAGLTDGEYVVTLWVDDARKPTATSLLRLRSGDTPVREVTGRNSGLVYRPSYGGSWPLTACERDESGSVDGARVSVGTAADMALIPMPAAAQRTRAERRSGPTRLVRVGRGLGEDSCMRTGTHRFVLPPALPGRPVSTSIEGECTTCGLVKRFPSTAHGARRRAPADVPVRRVDVGALPPVVMSDSRDHAVAFDALCHLGGGTASDFSRIAGQVEGTALFTDTFVRSLESLGHIDVRRDPGASSFAEFEMTPPTLIEVEPDVWWLVGRTQRSLVQRITSIVEAAGGSAASSLDHGVPRRTFRCTRRELELALREDRALAAADVELGDSIAGRLAAALPPLSSVAAALRRSPVPTHDTLAMWDTHSARWETVSSVARPGAYRLGGFAPRYGIRSPADVDGGAIAFCSPYLAKHVANLWARDPLAGYHTASRSVVVPRGCDLPTLYARALVLCSGWLPVNADRVHMLQYRDVLPEVAAQLHRCLSS
ncbi:MAG TPA: hypothetical protein VF519_01420 [Mycobacteriales bacterium]|jgi:hypothetical protein